MDFSRPRYGGPTGVVILDIDVRKSDTGPMQDDTLGPISKDLFNLFGPSASVPSALPPQPAAVGDTAGATDAALAVVDVAVLTEGSEAEVARHVLELVAASLRRPVAEILDGQEYTEHLEITLDSMTAVFVCKIIADKLGPAQMRAPRGNCQPNDFASTATVARLVCRLRRERVPA